MADSDKCIACGEIIPEGRQICPRCQHLAEQEKAVLGYGKKSCLLQILLVFEKLHKDRVAWIFGKGSKPR